MGNIKDWEDDNLEKDGINLTIARTKTEYFIRNALISNSLLSAL